LPFVRRKYFDSLVLTLYDNGIVDGDTVSVVLNDNVIIPRQGLTESAYRVVIPIPKEIGDSLRLVMYAENLGSIPPNTGLLIIEDGAARYEVRFEGDLQKKLCNYLASKAFPLTRCQSNICFAGAGLPMFYIF